MQATTTSSASSSYVSPISGPPVEKPAVTLADVLRGGAEQDRRSLQAYLHTLAAREKEKRKRKRMERKLKRSSSTSSTKKKRRSEDASAAAGSASTSVTGSASATSHSSVEDIMSSNSNTPSGSIDMSSLMRGSVDLSAVRMGSTGYDAMRGSIDMSAMSAGGYGDYAAHHHHHLRSRSVDFGALRSNAAAFDAMRGSLDMTAMSTGMGAHFSHHGSMSHSRHGSLSHSHHGSFPHHPAAMGAHGHHGGMVDFGADISPTSSFSMEGPVFLEPAPLASFSSVDEHSTSPQQLALPVQQPAVYHSQPAPHHLQQQPQMMPPAPHFHHPHQQLPPQEAPITELPEFDDFVSAAFLQAFPEDNSAASAPFTPSALLVEPGVPDPQPAVQQHQFAVPALPQHSSNSQRSSAVNPQQPAFNHHHQQTSGCSCPDCHATPAAAATAPVTSMSAPSSAVAAVLSPPSSANFDFSSACLSEQLAVPSGSQLIHTSLNQSFAAEEEQVDNFLASFVEWSEQCASSPLASMPSPASSLYF